MPLSPVAFGLVIHPIIRNISRSMGLICSVLYFYDGLLVVDMRKL